MKNAISPKKLLPTGATVSKAASPLAILVVEDNAVNQIVLVRLLQRRGHVVTAADNGLEALDLLGQTAYDCVIMDLEMPGLNGLETVARLRDPALFDRAATTPVVAMTAHTDRSMRERLLAGGFDAFVPKPVDMTELEAALGRAMASRPAPPDAAPTGA